MADDTQAREEIFGNELASNTLEVCRRAARLPPDSRHQFLSEWVFTAEGIRVTVDFTPLSPSPVAADLLSEADRQRVSRASLTGERRVQTGGALVSPILILVETAAETERLDELALRVNNVAPRSAEARRAKVVVRALIDIKREAFDAANQSISDLTTDFSTVIEHSDPDRSAATLLAWGAIQHPQTRETGSELVANLLSTLQHRVRTGTLAAGDGQVFMLPGLARVLHEVGQGQSAFAIAPPLQQWGPVSRSDARTRGLGWPLAHWQMEDGSPAGPRVVSLTGHFQDYLYFQSPLYGEYEVECDVTPGAWAEGHLMVAGCWVAPFMNSEIRYGTLRTESQGMIVPRRPANDDWMHFRAVVAKDRLSVTFDGHEVFVQRLPPHHPPWLAIRSRCEHQTSVRDLRISGRPVVPPQIQLATSAELADWTAYFEQSIGSPTADWRFEEGALIGRKRATRGQFGSFELPTGDESLLQYFRPILEDGAIEYEFYYEQGASVVHPALDRLVLLLRPGGVYGHWLTDGLYERTGADPLSMFVESDCRRNQLQLVEDGWNQAVIEVVGDVLRLSVNEALVYERPIEPTNERRFGLFHYSDQTEARVRNVVWHGSWNRAVPPIGLQELADPRLVDIEARSANLPEAWRHEFRDSHMTDAAFEFVEPVAPEQIGIQPDGLEVACHGDGENWAEHNLGGLFHIGGDFDIAASCDIAESRFKDPRYQTATLLFVICQTGDEDSFHIGAREFDGRHQVLEMTHNWRRPDGRRDLLSTSVPHACRGGTYRLVRHGERLLFLFAEGSSSQFRIMNELPAPQGDIELGGVRLLTQALKASTINRVLWKSLSVRGERFELPGRPRFVEALNRRRDTLVSESYDFAARGVDNDEFAAVGEDSRFQKVDDGLRTTVNGSKSSPVMLMLQRRLVGDFDVSVDFRTIRADIPIDSDNSGAWLQLRTAGNDAPYFNLLAATFPDSRHLVHAMTEKVMNGIRRPIPRGAVDCGQAGRLRFARRGTNLYLLFRAVDSDHDELLMTEPIGKEDVPVNGLWFMTHPGGEGRHVEILWQRAWICAEQLERA